MMKNVIPNYSLVDILGEGPRAIVYRAFHKMSPDQPLVLKILKTASLAGNQKALFQQKIEQLKILHDRRLLLPLSFEEKGGVRFVTQEYSKGATLDEWARTRPGRRITLADFFTIACALAEVIDIVHKAGIIHGGIKPHNILVHPETLEIRLFDFITSFDVRDVSHFIYERSFVTGTLAYTSPEQTGRINHRVDVTTDLYSLGIVFYELLTGRLPFLSTDPLELIHSHLAEEATPVHELNPDIPPVLSKIIAKLTLKQPEKRYQSGAGLLADLLRCNNEYLSSGTIKEFCLARNDQSHRVAFVSKMVGRDRESETILEEYDEAAKGHFRCLLISGLPGIGKTRLIQELQRPIVKNRGYFTSGKFDVYQKNIPYSALIQALRNLVRTFLTESDERASHWKRKVLKVVGVNGKVITDVLPELSVLIGPQPDVKPLPPVESRNRFHDLFGRFLTCLAGEEHPLTLFLDDLQWCDTASFDFLSNIFTNYKEHPCLFLLGAYRHSEVDTSHPLARLVQSVRENAQPLKEIRLGPLEAVHCHEMVSYILDTPLAQTEALSLFISNLTEGNPLFVSESLSYLHNEDLIFLDENRCWKWDMDKIRNSNMPTNVVALFSSKVQKLPSDTIELLEYCACMGNLFTPDEVALVREQLLLDTFEVLKPALSQGLLMENKNQLQFVHDRVQEAVLSKIDSEKRRLIHNQIGNHLLANIPKGHDLNRLDNIFTIASHLNLGRERSPARANAYILSNINYQAGIRALDSLATEAANEYFQQSLYLLPDDCWEVQYERTFKIFQKLAKTELMCGRYEQSEKLLNKLLDNAKTDEDKAEALAEQTTSLSSIGNFIKAIETANRGLAYFGRSIPDDPGQAETRREQLMNEIKSKGIDVWDAILNMPFTTERKSKIELAFYSELIPDLYMSGLVPQLYLAAVQSTRNCLEGGMDESVIYSFSIMGLYLGEQDEYEQAFRYEDLARNLSEKHPNTFGATRGMNGVVWCNMHSRSHPEEIVKYCRKSIQCGKNCGDLYNAGLSYGPLMWNLQLQGANLASVEEYAGECLRFSRKYQLSFSVGLAEAMQAGWIAPMKKDYIPVSIGNKIGKWEEDNHVASAGSYYVLMAVTCYYLGEYEKAEWHLHEVKKYLAGLTDNVLKRQWFVFQALNALKLYGQGIVHKSKEELLGFIHPIVKKIETWAELGPLLKPYLAFIYAERESVTGGFREARSLYLDAIASAHEQGYTLLEGHLNECLGELLVKTGHETARVYFNEAARLFKKCRAERKEMVLMEKYAVYFEEEIPANIPAGADLSVAYTLPSLDADYLIKSAIAISAEIDINMLLKKIMNVVIEASGAQDGYLLIEKNGDLVIRAESHVAEKDVVRTTVRKLDECKDVCQIIVRYVHRTKEKVVLQRGCEECEFKSARGEHSLGHKSILCLPVIKQARLVGILYLGNWLFNSDITPEKTQMTELLTSQAAISLENAQLVEEMKEAEDALRKHRDHLEEMVQERTRKLGEAQQGLIMAEKHIGLGRLAAGVAHEIKNQLTPVLTEAQRIIEQVEQGKEPSIKYITERVRMIEGAGRTANKITMALLEYAKESRPEFSRYNLINSILGIVAIYQPECKHSNIDIALENAEIEEIYADKRQLEQVLINIINNACEAIKEKGSGGRITISVKSAAPYAVISIQDTGIGIPSESQGKIFDPFFTTRAPLGAGLGLSVSYGIVERHRGHINFESRPGEGSTFRIYIPLREDEIHAS